MPTLFDMMVQSAATHAPAVAAEHLRDAVWGRLLAAGWQVRPANVRGTPLPGAASPESQLAAFLAGDPDAFTALYNALLPQLLGYAVKHLRDKAAAEDVAQTAFTTLVERGASILAGAGDGRPPNVRGYLFQVLHGLICDQQKKAARETPQDPHAPRAEQEDARAAEALAQVLLRHDGKRIAEVAAACLGPLEQAILGMAANGDNASVIAAELRLKPGTVRQKKARAITKLQAAMASAPGGAAREDVAQGNAATVLEGGR